MSCHRGRTTYVVNLSSSGAILWSHGNGIGEALVGDPVARGARSGQGTVGTAHVVRVTLGGRRWARAPGALAVEWHVLGSLWWYVEGEGRLGHLRRLALLAVL